jgi:hypothetical protein
VTPEDILDMVAGKKLLIHRDVVFFNTRDEEEVRRFASFGCLIIPWHEEQAPWRWREPPVQGFEVQLLGALDPIWELDEDGDEVEITAAVLLENARARIR